MRFTRLFNPLAGYLLVRMHREQLDRLIFSKHTEIHSKDSTNRLNHSLVISMHAIVMS